MRTLLVTATLFLAAPAHPADRPIDIARAIETAVADAARAAAPGVVTLQVHGKSLAADIIVQTGEAHSFPFEGTGSGFLVAPTGTVYTNAHVVQGADRIDVELADGRTFKADVLGLEEESDVAVLRLLDAPPDLPALPLGDSDAVRIGQFAIAIGAPAMLRQSVTVGHVSALHRRDLGHSGPGVVSPGFENLRYQDFIQVDTPINPGNSGGPLVDLDGRVIGINQSIVAAGGGGLGFAIPIAMAKRIADALIRDGRVRRGWLGVELSELDGDLAATFGLGVRRGALVNRVLPGSPAAAANVEEQDVFVMFDGKQVASVSDLTWAIGEAAVGKALPAKVFREFSGKGGREVELSVTLTEPPKEPATERVAPPRASALADFGLELVAPSRGPGAEVKAVAPGSMGEDAGLRVGDVLLSVDNRDVANVADAEAALLGSRRAFVPLRVLRQGRPHLLAIERP
jgi:S1-C subfamily serine protease